MDISLNIFLVDFSKGRSFSSLDHPYVLRLFAGLHVKLVFGRHNIFWLLFQL